MYEFGELVGDNVWCDTLAYWLCTISRQADLAEVTADGLSTLMSMQYDAEDQAGQTGQLYAYDADWVADFMPVAPVQLALQWSPAAVATKALGQPYWHDNHTNPLGITAVALAWAPSRFASLGRLTVRKGVGDQRRFVELFELCCFRASKRQAGMLVVLKPGWSYASVKSFDERTQLLMARAHFGVVDRRPPTIGAA